MHISPRLLRVLILAASVAAVCAAAAAAAGSIKVDRRFGADGTVLTDFGGQGDGARAVAVDSKGRTVAAGWATIDGEQRLAVSRYLRNGRLDGSFGTGGRVLTHVDDEDQAYTSVVVDGKDRVIAGGYAGYLNGDELDSADGVVARYRDDGTLDATFGNGGLRFIGIEGIDFLSAMALDHRGRIIGAGSTQSDAEYFDTRMVAFRISPSGKLDHSI
jgi:uncharacterized delta-60 repeat protein